MDGSSEVHKWQNIKVFWTIRNFGVGKAVLEKLCGTTPSAPGLD
jgi:hypothetical protein